MISKLGMGSRTHAANWVREGRVRVNGSVVLDPEFPVRQGKDRVSFDGREAAPSKRLVVMLNKPRGLITTVEDERGRDTVYRCFEGAGLPWLAPVGRLDKASEGLLLFTNDPQWGARITSPDTGPDKTYHVQIDTLPDARLLEFLSVGVELGGEHLAAKKARILRSGRRNAWLEIVLAEGRNRQIRRLLAALDVTVLRLIRTAIGPLSLSNLAKARWCEVPAAEIEAYFPTTPFNDSSS